MNSNRRDFLQKSASSLAALSAVSITGVGCTCGQTKDGGAAKSTCCYTPNLEPDSLYVGDDSLLIDLDKSKSLKAIESAAAIVLPEKELHTIVVHTAKKKYCALHRLCTHANQVVSYNHARDILQCNGHNHSIFALNGEVVKGPAERPLKTYPVSSADGKLVIALV